MKKLYLILFLFNIDIALAQQIILKGSIIDAQTSQPVAGPTISINEKNIYYPADGEGKFEIVADKVI